MWDVFFVRYGLNNLATVEKAKTYSWSLHFHAYLIRLLIDYIQLINFASLLPKKISQTIQGFQTHGAYSLHWVDSTCRESTNSSSSLDLNKDRRISQPADTQIKEQVLSSIEQLKFESAKNKFWYFPNDKVWIRFLSLQL